MNFFRLDKFIGSTQGLSLEEKTIRLFSAFLIIINSLSILLHISLQTINFNFVISSLFVLIFYSIVYVLSLKRFKYIFNLYLLVICTLTTISLEWYFFDGIFGGAIIMTIIVTVFYSIITKGIHSYIVLSLLFITVFTLFYLEVSDTLEVTHFSNYNAKVQDFLITLSISILVCFFIIKRLMKKFIEKEKLDYINMLLKDQNAIFMKQNFELEKMNFEKNRFISILAHDLRNPIGAAYSATNFMKEQYDILDSKDIKDLIISLAESSSNINFFLDTLLEWSMSESGMSKPLISEQNFSKILYSSVQLLKHTAMNKNIIINQNIIADVMVLVDKNMLATILRNLISNAIKFTPKSGLITIRSKFDDKFLVVEVNDTGIGIDSDRLNQIFQLGTKSTFLGTDNEKGNGLGLILCKEFVESLGGTLWIESRIGVGTSCFFTIPLAKSNI